MALIFRYKVVLDLAVSIDVLCHISKCKRLDGVIKKDNRTFVFKVSEPQRNKMTVKVKVNFHFCILLRLPFIDYRLP